MTISLGVNWKSARKAGLLRTFQRAVQRIIPPWIFDSNVLVAVAYDLDEWLDIRPDDKLQHKWVGKEDDHLIENGGMPASEMKTYRDQAARAHVILKGSETAAYSWVVPNTWDIYDWIQVRLATGEFYAAGTFVSHAYRGQRLQGELRRFAWGELGREGHKHVFTFVERLNRSSLRSQVKPARRYVGSLAYVRVLGLIVYRLDSSWGTGIWNKKRPLTVSFDMFDNSVSRPPKGAAT